MAKDDVAHLGRIMETGFGTLADLARETNARLDQTNARLDQTNARLDEAIVRLDRLDGRFDNLVEIAGSQNRELRHDVDDLRTRVEALEKKAS